MGPDSGRLEGVNTVVPVPSTFELPVEAFDGVGDRAFGIYVHVPFCATRCGYCDFNTYTAGELGTSASPQSWLEGLRRELDTAAELIQAGTGRVPTADTVCVGGGTPSLLGGDGLARGRLGGRAQHGRVSVWMCECVYIWHAVQSPTCIIINARTQLGHDGNTYLLALTYMYRHGACCRLELHVVGERQCRRRRRACRPASRRSDPVRTR